MAQTRLQMVGEEDATLVGEERPPLNLGIAPEIDRKREEHREAMQALLFSSLRALSQRTIVALGNLVALFLAASVFWLALSVANHPTWEQLVELTLYGAFVLVCLWIIRRREYGGRTTLA